jgi:hypothetical protein
VSDISKICTKCNLPGEFYPRGRKRWCKECCKAYFRDWYRKNPKKVKAIAKRKWAKPGHREKVSKYRKQYRKRGGLVHEREKINQRAYKYMRNYGITQTDYDQLYVAHDGRCAICRQIETRIKNSRVKWIAVDHDHKTNEVRGLLCHQCNVGIGSFKDDVELLEAAVRYLRGTQRFKS